tara:strand:- start:129 stop:332 length:204 start_codon:yes stop_codon:yes gene_type:complete
MDLMLLNGHSTTNVKLGNPIDQFLKISPKQERESSSAFPASLRTPSSTLFTQDQRQISNPQEQGLFS